MAGVTGLLAQARVYLPFSPVPVTGQTLGVLLAGVLLGPVCGGLSQMAYLALGMAGVPWFALGPLALFGPTGGYLVGFVVAAALVGYVNERSISGRRLLPQLVLMSFASALILLCGTLQLAAFLRVSLIHAALMGAVPFLAGDAVKTVLAASIATAVLPKSSSAAGHE